MRKNRINYFKLFQQVFFLCLFVFAIADLKSQVITGTKTVCTSGCDYTSIQSAVSALNNNGVGVGGATILVASGHTETAPAGGIIIGSATLNASLSSSNPLIIQKNGVGANPSIEAFSGTGTTDGIIKLLGVDFVTLNGLNLNESSSNINATTQMEWGIALLKRNASAPFDGCNNNTIQNCNIKLNRANTSGRGIYFGNHTSNVITNLTLTLSTDANSFNKIYNNSIDGAYYGINLAGFAHTTAPFNLYDQGNEVGRDNLGNTITNFGGTTTLAYGIYSIYQNELHIIHNQVSGGGVSHTTTLYGIGASTSNGARTFIRKNTVIDTSTSTNFPIYMATGATGGRLYVDSNIVTGCTNHTGAGILYAVYSISSPDSLVVTNNKIVGNKSTSTGAFYGIAHTSAAGGISITHNNEISNNRRNGAFYGIYSFGTANIFSIKNNIISGDTTMGTASLLYGIWQTSTNNSTDSIIGNQINHLFANGSGAVIGYFKNSNAHSGTKFITQNTINNLFSNTGSVRAINHPGGSSNRILQNNIFNIISNGTASQSIGIELGANSLNNVVANNFISEIKAPNSININGSALGVLISNGTVGNNARLFFNTILLDASMSGTSLNSACVKANTNPTIELRNNIFVNLSATGATGRAACYWREGSNLSTYHSNSNNNVYYTGGVSLGSTFFFNGTQSDTDIVSLKIRMGGRDGSSFSENVAFVNSSVSPYNLRINASVPTQIESAGSLVSLPFLINRDFDNNLRNVNTPDIGAHEGTFIGIDLMGPNISFTPPGMQQIASNIAINNVGILDPSGIKLSTASRPRIYYKKKSELNAISGNTAADNGWKYTLAVGTSSPFNFSMNTNLLNSPLSIGDSIEYFIIAEDSIGNIGVNSAQFSFPPSSVILTNTQFPASGIAQTISIVDTISGNFTVGVSGNFVSITAALDTLQRRLVTGPVVLNLVDPIYTNAIGGSEVFPIRVKKYIGTNSTNTITIKPAIGNNALVTGQSGFALFLFENGSEHIIIEGSNNHTNSKNLRLFNSIATQSTAIFMESTNPDFGVRDVTIKNTLIKGGNNGNSYGILMAANVVSPHTSTIAGAGTRRINIQNNHIYNTYYGIVIKGSNASQITDINITRNEIGTDTVGMHVQYFGIYLQSANNIKIYQNKIYNLRSTNSLNIAGIQLFNEVSNSSISNNEITGVYQQSTGGWGAAGIDLNQTLGNNNDSIYNNFISDIMSINYPASTIYNAFGLKIVGGTNIKVYHNSINLFGTPTIGTSATASACLLLQIPGNGLDVRNNILRNGMTGGIAGSKHYSLWVTALPPSNAIFDNNNFFVSATDGVLMRNNTVDVTTLANLRTTLNSNTNSINVNPQFSSNTRLYPGVGTVAGLGSSISTITRDFVDTLRNIPPSIGAIEKEADLAPPAYPGFSPFSNTSSLLNRNENVVIVDAFSGVAAASGSRPRIYFKKRSEANSFGANTNFVSGWKWVEANNTSSPFAFSIDYSLLFTALSVGDTIQYFIVAQDSIGNVGGIPELGLQLTSVANITQAPNSPFQYIVTPSPLAGIYTVGALGNYTSISSAVGALNLLGVSDAVTFALIDTVYTLTTPVEIFNAAGVSAANTVTFRPAPGVNAKITGTINDVLFRIVGARHIRFIGYDSLSLPAINLTIENWGTGNTIAIRNDASNNTISYCKVSGSSTAAANGIIAMNTSINTGNNFNTIEYCILTPTTPSAAPFNAIYMTGILAAPNTNNTVRNNYISNFINRGVFATTANNNLSISDNHFYQTIPRTATAAYAPIFVENSTGTNIQITNNYIGGSDSLCLGATPMTISGAQLMQLIFLQSAPSTWSNISGNKIANIHFTTTNATANHAFIFIGNGKVNCTNNEIGYDTSTNNIIFNYNGSGQSNLYGFGLGGVLAAPIFDSIIVSNNQMGGIIVGGTGAGISFRGIDYAGTTGRFIFENNLFGSRTTANSIVQNTANSFIGIINRNSNEQFTQRIIGNTFANISSNAGFLTALFVLGGTPAIIENNEIFNLTSNSSTQNGAGSAIALTGIHCGSSSANAKIVTKNKIYNLRTTTSSNIANASAIVHNNTGTATNVISKNSIHTIHANTSAKNNLIGIHHLAGNVIMHNNEIALGTDSIGTGITNAHTYAGIIKQTGNATMLYNSIRIQGNNVSTSDTMPSFALQRAGAGTDQIMNNILVNERSNSSTGGGLHLSLDINNVSGLSANHNVLHASAFNSDFVRVGSNIYGTLSAYQSATALDSASKSKLPNFASYNSLQLTGISLGDLDFLALPLANYPSDIRDSLRNLSTPYKGCYEDLSTPLPVGLNQFSVRNLAGDVQLNWQTSWEQNNKGFEIERSVNGSEFEKIAFVAGAINSATQTQYHYMDKNAFEKSNSKQLFYRLKQIDLDNKSTYSNTIRVSQDGSAEETISVYPNPFSNWINIKLNFIQAAQVNLELFDVQGTLVYQKNYAFEEGEHIKTVEPNLDIPAGVYFLHLIINDSVKTIKLIKN